MRLLSKQAAAAFLALAASVASAPLAAQETGFVEEQAIRRQIFNELKVSFDEMYREIAAETRKAPAAEDLEVVESALPMRKVARKGNGGSGVTL